MNLKKYLLMIITILMSFCFMACSNKTKEVEKHTKSFQALGTVIQVAAFTDNKKEVELAFDEVEKRVNEIENKMSVNIESSEISKLNSKGQARVSNDTYYVIEKALKYGSLSKGKLDITVEPLVKIWGIGTDHARVPKTDEINQVRKSIDYTKIKLNKNDKSVILGNSQGIDLGAIAKGYAADEIKTIFLKHGIKSACINLGGNVMTIGGKTDETDWKVGLQNPLANRDEHLGIIECKDLSVVTSGNYERFFEKDGVRYHHILDVSTGYPAKAGIISVTIISKNGIDGDALSTSVYILGVKEGLKLVESLKGIDAVIVTEDKKVYVTPQIKDKFKLTDDSFKICN